MSEGHHPIRWQEADPIMEAVEALVAAKIPVIPMGNEFERWQIGDLIFSDAELWRLAASCGLVDDGDPR